MTTQELKNSIKLHLSMAGGPSAELCMYTLKLIDFLDEDPSDEEITNLSYSILKSVALKIGDTIEKYAEVDPQFPSATLEQGQVLKDWPPAIAVGQPIDLIGPSGNEPLLAEIAKTLDMLKEHTKIEYPPIRDVSGKGL